jgi:antitoxin HicB
MNITPAPPAKTRSLDEACRMGTSRAHLNRMLDPENDKVQLDTVQRAAAAIGRKVRMELV